MPTNNYQITKSAKECQQIIILKIPYHKKYSETHSMPYLSDCQDFLAYINSNIRICGCIESLCRDISLADSIFKSHKNTKTLAQIYSISVWDLCQTPTGHLQPVNDSCLYNNNT